MNNIKNIFFAVFVMAFIPSFAMAGGLDDGIEALQTFQVWLYRFLGVASLLYLIVQVILAMMDKQQWGDVLIAVGKVAVAGGSVLLASWAWSIWGA